MKLVFHKTEGGGCSITARRNDGLVLSVPGSDEPSWLPRGLGHYVIERMFGLHRGRWGCIAAGAMFPGMEVVDGTLKAGALERSRNVLHEARQRPAEAEVMVTALTQVAEANLDSDPDRARAVLSSFPQAPYRPVGRLKHEEVCAACDGLREARELWHPLGAAESLSLIW